MKSAITVCQVPEALAGPFVLRTPLPEAFATAASLGFDAVELFLPGPDFITPDEILALAAEHKLAIAAVGTGAGMIRNGWSITDADPEKRAAAMEFLFSMIAFGGALHAPAILGSMQGKEARDGTRELLASALRDCGAYAARYGIPFIYEPLNRYETQLFNRLADASRFLSESNIENVVLLADLFHMNIEEADLPQAIRDAAQHIGHVHFADSNRQAMGHGHTDAAAVIDALREIGYVGYLSAEIFPLPDPEAAARQTISSIRSLITQ
jgi:sugar phosphate isomerase/epimerase